MSTTLTAEFGVSQVVEKHGNNGFEVKCLGAFDLRETPADPDGYGAEFFPAELINAIVILDWSRFAQAKPLSSYVGARFKVTLEAVSVPLNGEADQPADASSGELHAPTAGRRIQITEGRI